MSVKPDTGSVCDTAIAEAADKTNGVIGLAVSGGGDSIAMMHLAARTVDKARLRVFTVNHNLRAAAQTEIALVAAQAKALSLPHDVADWHWDRTGNLQAQARAGRWDTLCGLAARHQVNAVWMAHTQDDQIETFLMRLSRGSGIDGLSGMTSATVRDGVTLLRPLLGVSRAMLREWLEQNGIGWCDDPSNEDTTFDRVRARQMAAQLAELGLTPKRIVQTVDHMQAARASLQAAARSFVDMHYAQDHGDLIVARQALDLSQTDTPRRAMVAGLRWVSGANHKPRFENMMYAVQKAARGHKVTFAGCLLVPESAGAVRITREAQGTHPVAGHSGIIWDNRWLMTGPPIGEVEVKALGEAIRLCPAWRNSHLLRASLLASPAVWQNGTLIAAPLAGLDNGWTAQIVADFHSWAFAIED